MPNLVRYNIYLTVAQLAGMQRVYDESGIKISEQVRRALDVWLAERGQQLQTRMRYKTPKPRPSRAKGRTAKTTKGRVR